MDFFSLGAYMPTDADVIFVGAGLAGLAVELAGGGAIDRPQHDFCTALEPCHSGPCGCTRLPLY